MKNKNKLELFFLCSDLKIIAPKTALTKNKQFGIGLQTNYWLQTFPDPVGQ